MREFIHHPDYGEIVFCESFWTGKKKLSLNGVEAKRISKKEYTSNEKTMLLNGSTLTGATLSVDGKTIQLSPKPRWYEVALAVFPFLLVVVWGNNPNLYSVFPAAGGAIGGALGGIGSASALLLIKKSNTLLKKVLIGITSAIVTLLAAVIPTILIMLLYYFIFV